MHNSLSPCHFPDFPQKQGWYENIHKSELVKIVQKFEIQSQQNPILTSKREDRLSDSKLVSK